MTDGSSYQEAVATGMLAVGGEPSRAAAVDRRCRAGDLRRQGVVDLPARRRTDELVFEAVSGEGEGDLIGMRIPSSTGIAGWVLVTGQPIVIDDLQQDPRFARQAAERDGLRAAGPDGGAAR